MAKPKFLIDESEYAIPHITVKDGRTADGTFDSKEQTEATNTDKMDTNTQNKADTNLPNSSKGESTSTSKKANTKLGRPKKEITRKQYTLTLKETDYKAAMEQAQKEDISFAKLVEKALKEYISDHRF